MGIADIKAILDLPQDSDLSKVDLGFAKLLEGIVGINPDGSQLEQVITAILENEPNAETTGLKLDKDSSKVVLELVEGLLDSINQEEPVEDEELVPWEAFVNLTSTPSLPRGNPGVPAVSPSQERTNITSGSGRLSLVDNVWYNKPTNEGFLQVATKVPKHIPVETGRLLMEEVQLAELDGLVKPGEPSTLGIGEERLSEVIEFDKGSSVNWEPFSADRSSTELTVVQQVVPEKYGVSFNKILEPVQDGAEGYNFGLSLDEKLTDDVLQDFHILTTGIPTQVEQVQELDKKPSVLYATESAAAKELLKPVKSDQTVESEVKVNQLTNQPQEVIPVNSFKGLASEDLDSHKENGDQLDPEPSLANISKHPDFVTNLDNEFQAISSTLSNNSLEEGVFNQIIDRMQYQADGDYHEVSIQLKPDHLGDVKIKLAVEQGIVTAEFVMENQVVKEILASQLPELRQTMQELGMQLGQVDVSLSNNSGQREDSFQPRPQVFKPKASRQVKLDIQGSFDGVDSLSQVNLRV